MANDPSSAESISNSLEEDPTAALLSAFNPNENDMDMEDPNQVQGLLIAGLTLDAKGNEILARKGVANVSNQLMAEAPAPVRQPIFLGTSKPKPATDQAPLSNVRTSVPFDLNAAVQRSNTPFDSFNVEAELEKMRSMDGTDRFEYAGTVQANIAVRLAGIMKNYQTVAGERSGLNFAERNLASNIALDQASGFYAKYGEASKQTEAAQALLNQARLGMNQFAAHMAETDPEFAKLSAVSKKLVSIEQLNLNKSLLRDEKAEKKEAATAFITAPMMANYKFITGDTELDTVKLKDAILPRYNREPGFKRVIEASKEDMPALLTDSDAGVRQDAFKVLVGTERVLRAIPAGSPDPSYIAQIKKWVDNPSLLSTSKDKSAFTKDEQERLASIQAKSGKDKAQALSEFHAHLLTKNMERAAKGSFINDLRNWKTSETAKDTPLGRVISAVSDANSYGPADMPTVVSKFMLSDIEVPVGSPGSVMVLGKSRLSHASKQKILEVAANTALSNAGKSVLLPNSDALAIELRDSVRTEAQKAMARFSGIFGLGHVGL